jgi:hypothetical protein
LNCIPGDCCSAEFWQPAPPALSPPGSSTEVVATEPSRPLPPRADYPCASHAARNPALAPP